MPYTGPATYLFRFRIIKTWSPFTGNACLILNSLTYNFFKIYNDYLEITVDQYRRQYCFIIDFLDLIIRKVKFLLYNVLVSWILFKKKKISIRNIIISFSYIFLYTVSHVKLIYNNSERTIILVYYN